MHSALPPLNALRAFEAAARHLSFTKAAEELRVTPAAISHQIRGLEEYVDTPLFHRLQRSLRLTAAGQALAPGLGRGFREIEGAVAEVMQADERGPLTVSAAPSFAAMWLVPRIEDFRARHPEVEVRIDASTALTDFERDAVDIAVRYGPGDYSGLMAERLIGNCVSPVASPALLARTPLERPADIRNHTLIHVDWRALDDGMPNWRMWAAAAGVDDAGTDDGPRVNDSALAVQMALAGQGLALVDQTMVTDHIEAGRLVQPFDVGVTGAGDFAYYMVAPERQWRTAKVTAFREWLRARAGTV